MNSTASNGRVVVKTMSPYMLGYKRESTQEAEEDKRLKVAAYARVSTDHEEQEFSFERQNAHFQQVIASRPAEWKFVKVYSDDGITGTKLDRRSGFRTMIQDCLDGKIDKILVKSISRFARNTVDTLNTIRELKELGIGVYFESENIDTLTPGGEVLITILAAMAEQESRTISMNIKWAYQRKFQNGVVVINTKQALGYRKVGVDSEKRPIYEIVEEEAEIIRRIFKEFLQGRSVTDICRGLEEDGIKTKIGTTHWNASTIRAILQNEKYTGNAILGKTFSRDVLCKRVKSDGLANPVYYAENTHPAIIEMEIFERAKLELERRKAAKECEVGNSRYTSRYPFSGLLECAECGSRMRRQTLWFRRGVKVPTWSCKRHIDSKDKCGNSCVKESVLEATYLAALNELIENANEVIEAVRSSAESVMDQNIGEQIKAIDDEVDAIHTEMVEALRRKRKFEISQDQFDELTRQNEEKQIALLEKRKEIQKRHARFATVYEWIRAIQEKYLEGEKITSIDVTTLKLLVEKIIVKSNGIEVRFNCGVEINKKYTE